MIFKRNPTLTFECIKLDNHFFLKLVIFMSRFEKSYLDSKVIIQIKFYSGRGTDRQFLKLSEHKKSNVIGTQ